MGAGRGPSLRPRSKRRSDDRAALPARRDGRATCAGAGARSRSYRHRRRTQMRLKAWLLAIGLVLAWTIPPASAATLRFAFQGDLKSLDPYSLNEGFTLGVLGNVYEGLTKRGKNLEIIPGLAERWEVIEPTRWRFYLRKGVKFHNGEDFTADDVLFSAERVRASGSDLKTRLPADAKVVKVDDY